jgi:hypothetical protein
VGAVTWKSGDPKGYNHGWGGERVRGLRTTMRCKGEKSDEKEDEEGRRGSS